MIATTGDIEVTNPDLVICHLDEGATLNMELTVDIGKGYQPAAANRPADAPIGLIPVDALYSPGAPGRLQGREHPRRAGARLRQADADDRDRRHGRRPEDALGYAARILQDQLQLFVHFDESQVRMAPSPMIGQAVPMAAEQIATDTNQLNRYLLKKVDELELSRAQRQLPEERQHHLHRRPRPEDRGRDAAHPELRPQEPERDQGSAGAAWACGSGMDIPGWPPENIEEMAKKLEQEMLG